MQARGIFAFGAVVVLAVSATTILFLHPKHGSELGASEWTLDASSVVIDASAPLVTASAAPLAATESDPCAGKQRWISGPPDDRLTAHVNADDLHARLPTDLARTLNVLFSPRATVAQANAALCEANVTVVGKVVNPRLLNVEVSTNGGPEVLHLTRGKLIAHRFVEAVSPGNMTSLEEGLAFKRESARLGFNRCDWASGQLARKLAIAKPAYCHQSERREIDGREILFAAVRADDDCAVVAIVDDDGVFPHTARCKPSSPFAKLAATELTGTKHASLGADEGKKAVEKMLGRIEQRQPK